jgi:heme exporter protein A
MPETYLSVKNLTHAYGRAALFSGLSFDLAPGTLLQVTGRNGSGKTTLLKLLSGIKPPQEGSVEWGDVDCAYLGHKNAIKTELSPLENLTLYQPDAAACAHTLEDLGLEKSHYHRPCYRLSAGQQRKVALSRVVLSTAKIWLLDEPFTALDETAKAHLLRHLTRHANDGGSAVVATHERLAVEKSILRELVMS